MPRSLPLLLLIALACRAVPVRAQDGPIVETTLPAGDVSATLKVLAAQARRDARRAGRPPDAPAGLPQLRQPRGAGAEPFGAAAGGADRRAGGRALVRNPGGMPAVYQQGNHMPDANNRWMGSIAMDKRGNIALGYSVTGPATPPGIRYTGRMRSEPLGRLKGEEVLVNGAGVQIDTFHRWGDYSAMTVDPVNDCAFWYPQQYIAVTGDFNWRARIADFKFINCK